MYFSASFSFYELVNLESAPLNHIGYRTQ